MTASTKTVVRFNTWIHPEMVTRFEAEPDISFVTLEQQDTELAWAAFAEAHGYQIAASRDELAPHWHACAPLLERAPNLLCVSSGGAGYDTVDVEACTAAGVLVVNQAGGNAQSVAEHTIGLILDVSKRISETDRRMRSSRGYPREDLMGHEISGRTIGLIGLGHAGRRVAALARAFNLTVLATDPYLDHEEVTVRGAEKVDLDELLARADIVSVHCPRDNTTFGMMNAQAFAQMKPGAIFITTARGGIHDETALDEALRSGHLAGAGLDVWAVEPPDLDHPLLTFDNVVATFHTAGVTFEARGRMARYASDQLIGVLSGERPPRLINPQVWPRYAERFQSIMGFAPAA
ncbi:MAG: hydroxyacid dehydrogenase [Hyphomicrobiaceae bacterium]